MLESVSAATDLDLMSYLKAIPDARRRRGVHIPAWYLLQVAVFGVLSRCQSLWDLERFAIRHHGVLTEALGLVCIALGLPRSGCQDAAELNRAHRRRGLRPAASTLPG